MHLFFDKINKYIILLLNSCTSINKHTRAEFIIKTQNEVASIAIVGIRHTI